MNSNRNPNLYDLSKQIEEEQNNVYQKQAKKIANAYRQVQQLKVNKQKHLQPKQQSSKNKPQSAYALKVKETLSQLKSQQNKQMPQPTKLAIQPSSSITRNQEHEYTKLQTAGVSKLYSTIQSFCFRMKGIILKKMIWFAEEDEKKESQFLLKFRKYKIFRAWKDEFILSKLQRERKQQSNFFQMSKAEELSKQFRIFSLLSKTFKRWKQYIRRQAKRKLYQQQLRRLQLQKMMKEEQEKSQKNPVKQNQELHNKLRGFLDGLKGKIENKDRLKTIKENPDQSDVNVKIRTDTANNDDSNEEKNSEVQQINSDEDYNSVQRNNNSETQVIIQPPQNSSVSQKKTMTNDQLEKRRQQLENKHRKRKEALQKLKKEKDEKKKEEELQRAEIEKEVQLEQKKIKQEKYKQFLKHKQEQEQWERKENILQSLADQFNLKRLLKYHGWIPLLNAKKNKKKLIESLYQTLLLILYRIKGEKFLNNLTKNCEETLLELYKKIQERYTRKLKAKVFNNFLVNFKEEKQNSKDSKIRHQVNVMKIYFTEWKKVHPNIVQENFDWDRPRIKKAEEFYKIQLLHKGLGSLKQNKVEEQKHRTIFQQKQKIKSKIQDLLGEEDINYEQFL